MLTPYSLNGGTMKVISRRVVSHCLDNETLLFSILSLTSTRVSIINLIPGGYLTIDKLGVYCFIIMNLSSGVSFILYKKKRQMLKLHQ